MKKPILLLFISSLMLSSCGTSVSLTANYFEDENYYNPALPAPRFASAKAMGTMDSEPYTDEDFALIWEGEQPLVSAPLQGSTNAWWNNGRSYWTPGFGTFFYPQWNNTMGLNSWNSMGGYHPYGYNGFGYDSFGWNSGMGMGGFSPYAFDPYGWNNGWNSGWGMGYNPYGYTPYGYNPYGFGWNAWNGVTNFGSTASSPSNEPTRTGINYGGRRPNKYRRSGGQGSTSGRTDNYSTDWRAPTVQAPNTAPVSTSRGWAQPLVETAQKSLRTSATTSPRGSSRPSTTVKPAPSVRSEVNYSQPNTRSTYERSGNYRVESAPATRSSNTYTPSAPARSGSTSNSSGSRRR